MTEQEMKSAAEHGTMVRNADDVWPDDAPPGTFDIEPCTIEGYPGVTAHLLFECPNRHRCGVLLAPQPIDRGDDRKLHVWGWNGNVEKPTLTPSINCIAEKDGKPTGGCGWHGFITNGVIR
jgi:hypothetical protein